MARKNLTLLEKITDLENKTRSLIETRNKELLEIIKHSNAIAIDDSLLTGFLLFALEKQNKDHPILKEFKELAKANRIPSKTK